MKRLPLSDDADLPALARNAEGFSGADLAGLAWEAAMLAIRRAPAPDPDSVAKDTEPELAASLCVTSELLSLARRRVAPSVSADERRLRGLERTLVWTARIARQKYRFG